jgi:hypothetical protein
MPRDGALARLRAGLYPLARRADAALDRLPRTSPFARAIVVCAAAVAFVAALTYYGADEFSHRAVDQRAATEAGSLADLAGHLATGDAYQTYLEMLRYAADPRVHNRVISPDDRRAAMQQQLYLNTNNLDALAVADRAGNVLATTDPSISHVLDSDAYLRTRNTLTAANSDVVMPSPGATGYVEFSVPLRDDDGGIWGVLLGRADPARLWAPTLEASVDGSRTLIISGAGEVAAGVPQAMLKQPWRAEPLSGGGVRAAIDGIDSICAASAIGQGSPIDRGTLVASCLPASLVGNEHTGAMDRQGWVTISGAVLALVLAAGALHIGFRERRPLLLLTGPKDESTEEVSGEQYPPASPPAAPAPASVAVIEAYERRNERISELLREGVRARLLLAATEAQDAYARHAGDEADGGAHAHAIEELEDVRDRELRRVEQELYPGVVRLGLPNALKALRRDLAGDIDLTLAMDPRADALDADGEREAIPLGCRLVLYRFVLDGARGLAAAGAREALVTLRRDDAGVTLSLSATNVTDATGSRASVEASRLAIEAYGGSLAWESADNAVRAVANFAG